MLDWLRSAGAAGLLIAVLAMPPPVRAVNAGDAALTLAGAVARALDASPRLAVFPYALRAADAERAQAALRPNPTVSLRLEDVAGTGRVRGLRGVEATLMLSQVLELGHKRRRREAVAARTRTLTAADYAIARLDVLAEVARRTVHVARDQALLDIAAKAASLARANRAAVARRVDAARSSTAELNRAEIELARARLAREHREHELAAARRRLAASWGAETVDFAQVDADLDTLPETRALDALLDELRTSPDLARFIDERRLREAELALAEARAVPDATLGLGLRRLEGIDEQALMLSFSMALPVFDRNQGNIAAAQARRRRVDIEATAAYVEAQALVFGTFQELSHARTALDALASTIVPQAIEALAAYEAGYAEGRFSYLEVAAARRELISLETERVMAAASYHTFLIELERLTGLALGVTEDAPR
ncbi:MAG: TolC family protein [Gammaproteobacteria bacterium]